MLSAQLQSKTVGRIGSPVAGFLDIARKARHVPVKDEPSHSRGRWKGRNCMDDKLMKLPLGVVVRRAPGVTRWAAWSWRAVAVLPGAAPAHWKALRRDGDAVEYHAGTLTLELHASDTAAYLENLDSTAPCIFVMMMVPAGVTDPDGITLSQVTANPYGARDYVDAGEMLAERVPMPPMLGATIRDFVDLHHVEEPFIKRKRDKRTIGAPEEGRGDARVRQGSDVYRAPTARRRLQ